MYFSVNISEEHKRTLVEYWLGKADESIASASSELNAGRLTFPLTAFISRCFTLRLHYFIPKVKAL